MKVTIRGAASMLKEMLSGMPQGSQLGPMTQRYRGASKQWQMVMHCKKILTRLWTGLSNGCSALTAKKVR